ncbi:MAG TPA: PilZ domain-containing protein [Polyangia bacterium]
MADATLHIVTTQAELLGRLQGGYLGRACVRVTAAPDGVALPRYVAQSRPDVVIVGGKLAPARERELADAVRATAPGGLLLRAVPFGATAPRDAAAFDHVVADDELEDALAALLPASLAGPARLGARVPVRLPALLCSPLGATVPATTVDLSADGAGLRAERPVPRGTVLTVVFHRPDGRRVGVCGEVVWVVPAAQGARIGLRFVDEGEASLRALRDLAFWEIAGEGAAATMRLYGNLDGTQDLSGLAAAALDVRRVDLDGVVAVTTAGLAAWLRFLRALPPGVVLRLSHVPAPLAAALRRAADLDGRCRLVSCYVAWACLACELEVSELVLPDGAAARPRCPACDGRMRPVHASGEMKAVRPTASA